MTTRSERSVDPAPLATPGYRIRPHVFQVRDAPSPYAALTAMYQVADADRLS
ncbi:MAG: hypothetical protein JO152_12220 [Mycobacteriaceae bacterium]|nr:hypothetical protein [Mycobacteriaceae bacterium]